MLAVSAGGWILIATVMYVLFLLWVFCLFDVIVRGNMSTGTKVIWVLALIVLAPFAIIAWFGFGRSRANAARLTS
jgi:hypothetical protein